ncbi:MULTISPECIES: TMEM175 family protein [unclassified Pseudoxanthomonas]|uniref:TMEM175 family protein n=1 Tax=unclassified Pseudoxanthomonas TaxID=2645906 RepID=UPI00307825D5
MAGMGKGRMEGFSDGVMAIIITIMVLELRVPHGSDLGALRPLIPAFLSYVLSFVYIGIYWNNHHHLMHAAKKVSGGMLWANLNFLFWLSLFPFATAWMGENHFETMPSAVYGFVLLMTAIAYYLLQRSIIFANEPESALKHAIGKDWKGKLPPLLYVIAIILSFRVNWIAQVLYVSVALIWLVPDRRIERAIGVAGS